MVRLLFSYCRDVQKPGLGHATDFVGFPVGEEGGLSLDFSWMLRASINLINISLSSFAILDLDSC